MQTIRRSGITRFMLVAVVAAACGDEPGSAPIDASAGADAAVADAAGADAAIDAAAVTMVQATIGPAGGTLEIDNASVTIPAGAVAVATQFTLALTADTTFGITPLSPVYRLTPANSFALPVTYSVTSTMNAQAEPSARAPAVCPAGSARLYINGPELWSEGTSLDCVGDRVTGQANRATAFVKAKPLAP